MKPFTAIALLIVEAGFHGNGQVDPSGGKKINRLYEDEYADEDEDSPGNADGLLQDEDENAYADKNEAP